MPRNTLIEQNWYCLCTAGLRARPTEPIVRVMRFRVPHASLNASFCAPSPMVLFKVLCCFFGFGLPCAEMSQQLYLFADPTMLAASFCQHRFLLQAAMPFYLTLRAAFFVGDQVADGARPIASTRTRDNRLRCLAAGSSGATSHRQSARGRSSSSERWINTPRPDA